MYTQIFLVTSVRGIDCPPQTAANAGLRVFGAKSPTPFFFIAAATLLPDAFVAVFVILIKRMTLHASVDTTASH